jgi:hypothetical protein
VPAGSPHGVVVQPEQRRSEPRQICRSALAARRRSGQCVGMDETTPILEDLLAQCRRDHEAWINGDQSGYAFPEGATLMGAFGGSGHTKPMTEEQQRIFGALWQSGTGDVELIDGGVSEDIAWLVMVERASVRFRDRNETERWDLRVTELFKRNGDVWERFHRHADPLVEVHGLDDIRRLLG